MSETREPYGVDEYLKGDVTVSPQELVWGRVRDAPSPTPGHQQTVFDFGEVLEQHVEERQLGVVLLSPMDCVLDVPRALIVQPDVLFVTAARAHIIRDRVWGAPDLVVEVLSPRPRIGTLAERLEWFAKYGVRECWLYRQVLHELEVVDFSNGAAGRRTFSFREPVVSSVLPGFDRSCASFLRPHTFY